MIQEHAFSDDRPRQEGVFFQASPAIAGSDPARTLSKPSDSYVEGDAQDASGGRTAQAASGCWSRRPTRRDDLRRKARGAVWAFLASSKFWIAMTEERAHPDWVSGKVLEKNNLLWIVERIFCSRAAGLPNPPWFIESAFQK